MRKIECSSFKITGNTNFAKKLTSFVSKFVWGTRAESQKCKKFADTAGAEAMR